MTPTYDFWGSKRPKHLETPPEHNQNSPKHKYKLPSIGASALVAHRWSCDCPFSEKLRSQVGHRRIYLNAEDAVASAVTESAGACSYYSISTGMQIAHPRLYHF